MGGHVKKQGRYFYRTSATGAGVLERRVLDA